MWRYVGIVFLLGVAVGIIPGCLNPSGGSGHPDRLATESGTLLLRLGDSNTIMASIQEGDPLQPDVLPQVVDYVISGVGPGGESLLLDPIAVMETDLEVEIPGLRAGTWTITVDARDAAPQEIGRGTAAVLIEAGKTTTQRIIVRPLDAFGTLELTIRYPLTVSEARVSGTLVNVDTDATTVLSADGEGNGFVHDEVDGKQQATFSGEMEGGRYILSIQLADPDIPEDPMWGVSVAVRISAGETTVGEADLEGGDLVGPVGSVALSVVHALGEPLLTIEPFSLAHPDNGPDPVEEIAIEQGEPVSVYAEVTSITGELEMQWYLQGIERAGDIVDQGEEFAVVRTEIGQLESEELQAGAHTLSLVVSDDLHVVSRSVPLIVEEPLLAFVVINLDGVTGDLQDPLYYDLLDADIYDDPGPSLTFDQLFTSLDFEEWYADEAVVLLDTDRQSVAKVGFRDPLEEIDPQDGLREYVIEGIVPGENWRILITTWDDREFVPLDQDVALSDSTILESGENTLTEVDFEIRLLFS